MPICFPMFIKSDKKQVLPAYFFHNTEIEQMKKESKKMRSLQKFVDTPYGNGLLNSSKQSNLTELVGLIGEKAVSLAVGAPRVQNDYSGPIDADIILNGCKIDVKTKSLSSRSNMFYFQICKKYHKSKTDKDKYIEVVPRTSFLKSHVYFFCSLYKKTSNGIIVVINGWITRKYLSKNLLSRIEERQIKGSTEYQKWYNVVIKPSELRNMNEFIKWYCECLSI